MFGLSFATIRLIAYGVMALTLLGGVAYVKHEWDAGQQAQAQIHVLAAQTKAVTVAVAAVDKSAGAAERKAQTAIASSVKTIIKRIPTYVHVSTPSAPVPCIPWGFVRLHDAAVLGVDPGSLPSAAGQSDDACSTITYPALAGVIADNYAAARANGEQLNALEADIKARSAATAAASQTPSK